MCSIETSIIVHDARWQWKQKRVANNKMKMEIISSGSFSQIKDKLFLLMDTISDTNYMNG